jgi:hypothetical protein
MLDPVEILHDLADSCQRRDDDGFWILVSAAAWLSGYFGRPGPLTGELGLSSVAVWWVKQERECLKTL